MTIGTIHESQRRAAKVVGLSYLFALPPAIFAEFYVLGRLLVYNNAVDTARNIMAHERLFRLGTASNLTVFAIDIVLITALYAVLKPVNRNLALLAAFWGLIENAILLFVVQVELYPKSIGGMGNLCVLSDGSVRILVHHLSRACEGRRR